MKLKEINKFVCGYGSTASDINNVKKVSFDYLKRQYMTHKRRVDRFLDPFLERYHVKSVLDVGCGVGVMVKTLLDYGYDAYGVDLICSVDSWLDNDLPRDRFFVVDPFKLDLPFESGTLDFIYSFGVLEHVGTVDGHADRRHDYHEIRKQWLLEIFRILRVDGYMLIGGPNRKFPVDTHGPDSKASKIERWIYKKFRLSIHKTWGEHFLWGYKDIVRYLSGMKYEMEALSMKNYYEYEQNTPKIIEPFFKAYVNYLPKTLLATGFNPWVIALIKKNQ